jgi:hypothetical protein
MLVPAASNRAPGAKKHPMRGGNFLQVMVFSIGLPGAVFSAAEPQFIAYGGNALETGSGAFLYAEHHVLKYEDGRLRERVVLYQCADGSSFARKTASYARPLAPDFLLEDSSNGVREGVRDDGGLRTVFFRANPQTAERSAPLKIGPEWVIDSGFDEFIRATGNSS